MKTTQTTVPLVWLEEQTDALNQDLHSYGLLVPESQIKHLIAAQVTQKTQDGVPLDAVLTSYSHHSLLTEILTSIAAERPGTAIVDHEASIGLEPPLVGAVVTNLVQATHEFDRSGQKELATTCLELVGHYGRNLSLSEVIDGALVIYCQEPLLARTVRMLESLSRTVLDEKTQPTEKMVECVQQTIWPTIAILQQVLTAYGTNPNPRKYS